MMSQLKARLASAPDTEAEQAVLRIAVLAAILFYYVFFVAPANGWSREEILVATGMSGFFIIGVGILLSILIRPQKEVWRRIVGILSDNGWATFYVWLAGENGALMIFVYLFVAFGNGARYGARYLWFSAALSCFGFLAAILAVPFWQYHEAMGIELLLALVILPLYVSRFLALRSAQIERLRHEVASLQAMLARAGTGVSSGH